MASAPDDTSRARHRAVIASRSRDWYNVQLVKCSADAEIMLQRIEQTEFPTDVAALQNSFPLTRFRSGRD
jgi:hypothetical protein